ncbi:NAD(P)-dependent oxidoreductase [Arthrobacter sp. NPDC080073]|uniref:NAD-dependent epimerase/dehydratase family protein n=1 Tax=Arthrobacter sp. NPDC080073 TaxID=3155919 RepID=UPI00343B48C3
MSTVLVTGATGFIGSRLVRQLRENHDVIAFARGEATEASVSIRGDFSVAEDLAQLDGYDIDAVVHLAGVTGGSSEEDAFRVNVAGSRRFFRYAIDHGINHFVVASSIAAAGCLSDEFLPSDLPIPDDHPGRAFDAYGLSKSLMESTIRYFGRTDPGLEFTVFRIGAVLPEDAEPAEPEALQTMNRPFCQMGTIAASDVVDAIALAATHPVGPGVRQMNLVAPLAGAPIPTAEALRAVLGAKADDLDLSFYESPGNSDGPLYAVDRLYHVYGFRPRVNVRTMRNFADEQYPSLPQQGAQANEGAANGI